MYAHPRFLELKAKYEHSDFLSDYQPTQQEADWLVEHIEYLMDEQVKKDQEIFKLTSMQEKSASDIYAKNEEVSMLNRRYDDLEMSYNAKAREADEYKAKYTDAQLDIETLEQEVKTTQDSLDYYKEALLRRISTVRQFVSLVYNRCSNHFAPETAEMVGLIHDAISDIENDYSPSDIPF